LVYNNAALHYEDTGLAAGASHDYTVAASSAGGDSVTASTSPVSTTVPSACSPNLTVAAPNQNAATIDVAQTFTATITNSVAPTGASFPYFFQVASLRDGEGTLTDKAFTTTPALNAGGTVTATVSHTFTTPGVYSIRVCADKQDSGHAGVITESNESDNCSGWRNVNVVRPSDFVTTWKTNNSGTSNTTSITIPTTGTGYLYQVDWNNDGDFLDTDETTLNTGNVTHSFGVAGTYTIRIRGSFPRIYFNNAGDKLKLLSVEQW